MHNLCAKKKRKPLLLKQMLRSHFTLSLAYDVQLYESHLTSQHTVVFILNQSGLSVSSGKAYERSGSLSLIRAWAWYRVNRS